jgi:multiple sugar transport system substrate-binding protein
MIGIDPGSPIPIYYQLKTMILEDIIGGTYQPGDRLPTEHEFCARHGISRTPVHRALTELADEGVILRARRRGTFVNPHWVPRGSAGAELRVLVTDSQWAEHIRNSAPDHLKASVAAVQYDEMRHTITSAVAEGRAPDLALIDEVWIADFADAGFLLPIDDLDADWVEREYERDFVATFVDGRRYNGHVYAIPEEINVGGLWCRRDALDSVDSPVPTTWDELTAITRRLQPWIRASERVFAMPGGHVAGETTTYCLLAVLASNGATVIDDAVTLDSGSTVTALRFLRSLVEDGVMAADVVTYDWTRCPNLLGAGRAAITVGGSYEAEVIAAAAGIGLEDVPDHFTFSPFPAGPGGAPATIAGGMAYAVFRQSSDPNRALRLLKHIVATERLAERAYGRLVIPPRQSAIELAAAESPFMKEASALFAGAATRPVIPDYHLVSTQLQNMLEAVLTGRYGPATAVERTAEITAAITGLPVLHT